MAEPLSLFNCGTEAMRWGEGKTASILENGKLGNPGFNNSKEFLALTNTHIQHPFHHYSIIICI